MQFENLDNKERIILEFKFDTETFDVKLYKQGTIKVLANFLSYKKAIEEAKKYIESQKESLKLKIKVGRKWIGIEREQEYVDIANKRLEKYINQTRLFKEE